MACPIDGVNYYHNSLRRWIGKTENGKPRQFAFRKDPRDISSVSFFDPEIKKHFRIPFRDNTYGFTSLWEFRQAKAMARKNARSRISESEIFNARDEMRKMVNDAAAESKKARRQRLSSNFAMVGDKKDADNSDSPDIYVNTIKPFLVDESA